MGCPLSKTSNESESTNNKTPTTAENKNGEGAAAATAKPSDPRLPLNVRQKFNLSKSWKGISREMEMTGVLMFVKLFEENSELINLFTKFQELKTRDSQMKSMELAEHATKVMSNLDEMINSLDDMDYFFTHLHNIGKLHRKLPGFKKEYFFVSAPLCASGLNSLGAPLWGRPLLGTTRKMERPFLEAVKEVLQDRYTENMENIYNIIIKLILQTLADGFEKDYD